MTQFGATLLEDVVLKLCHSQELEQCPIKNDINSWDNNNTHDLDGNIQNISYKRRSSRDHWVDVTSARKYSNYSVNRKFAKSFAKCKTFFILFVPSFFLRHGQTSEKGRMPHPSFTNYLCDAYPACHKIHSFSTLCEFLTTKINLLIFNVNIFFHNRFLSQF